MFYRWLNYKCWSDGHRCGVGKCICHCSRCDLPSGDSESDEDLPANSVETPEADKVSTTGETPEADKVSTTEETPKTNQVAENEQCVTTGSGAKVYNVDEANIDDVIDEDLWVGIKPQRRNEFSLLASDTIHDTSFLDNCTVKLFVDDSRIRLDCI